MRAPSSPAATTFPVPSISPGQTHPHPSTPLLGPELLLTSVLAAYSLLPTPRTPGTALPMQPRQRQLSKAESGAPTVTEAAGLSCWDPEHTHQGSPASPLPETP